MSSHNALVLDVDDLDLPGTLTVPDHACNLVIFARDPNLHASRDQEIAQALQEGGIATLLFDLLTETESRKAALRFDLGLLSRRFLSVARWAATEALSGRVPLGYFGVHMGGIAAIAAAAEKPALVRAVVCENGRLDLAGRWLPRLRAPTLLIASSGGADAHELAVQASGLTAGPCEIVMVPAPADTGRSALDWFRRQFHESGLSGRDSETEALS